MPQKTTFKTKNIMNSKSSFFMALVALAMSLSTTIVFFKHINDCSEKNNNIFEVQSKVFTKDDELVEYRILYKVSKEDLELSSEVQINAEKLIRKELDHYIGNFTYKEFYNESIKQAHEKVIYEQLRFAFVSSNIIAIKSVVLQPCYERTNNFAEKVY